VAAGDGVEGGADQNTNSDSTLKRKQIHGFALSRYTFAFAIESQTNRRELFKLQKKSKTKAKGHNHL